MYIDFLLPPQTYRITSNLMDTRKTIILATLRYNWSTRKLLVFKVSDEFFHACAYSHSDNRDRKYKQLQRNEKVPWWARKRLAAFSTTKETLAIVDCKFAVVVHVPCYSH